MIIIQMKHTASASASPAFSSSTYSVWSSFFLTTCFKPFRSAPANQNRQTLNFGNSSALIQIDNFENVNQNPVKLYPQNGIQNWQKSIIICIEQQQCIATEFWFYIPSGERTLKFVFGISFCCSCALYSSSVSSFVSSSAFAVSSADLSPSLNGKHHVIRVNIGVQIYNVYYFCTVKMCSNSPVFGRLGPFGGGCVFASRRRSGRRALDDLRLIQRRLSASQQR